MAPVFFKAPAEFRKWLMKNHAKEKELLVGFYKISSKKPSMTWPGSVDEALCFGWIDGIRRSIDQESYSIRFTPRKPRSIWSTVNIRKMEEQILAGKMQPAGFAAYERREAHRSEIYSYEKDRKEMSAEIEKLLKANKKAWAFFQVQAPSYKKVVAHWVMSAKKEETRLRRLEELICDCLEGRKIRAVSYEVKKK